VLFAADSSWSKVKDLKNRSELRIYKKGAREPLNATFYEANDERLTVVVKNEQIAIDRQEIDRIDARAATTKRKVNVESTAKDTDPDLKPHPYAGAAVPSTSYSSNVSTVSKPDFETIYRRPAGPAKN
jgi:hypothetical protein